jgi:hypothetical protein
MGIPRRLCLVVAAMATACAASMTDAARADEVRLLDGRVLKGRFALLPGVAVDPRKEVGPNAGGTTIVVCDDELTRTMVSKRQVAGVEEGPVDLGLERILIPQRVPEKGGRVVGIGGALRTTPFDEFGRRSTPRADESMSCRASRRSRRAGHGSRGWSPRSRSSSTCGSPPARFPGTCSAG